MPDFYVAGKTVNMDNMPCSIEDWIALARRHQNGARVLKRNQQFSLAWDHVGLSVECYLKAALMRKFNWRRFPDRQHRPDLYTHDLSFLLKQLGISIDGMNQHPVASRLKTLLDWRRRHGYNPAPMPEKYAEQIYTAAFSTSGVVEWIVRTFQLPC